jgi:hypothetical protein
MCRNSADMPRRQGLYSSSTQRLDARSTRLTTIGDRVFPVAAAKVWNSLPDEFTAASSLVNFRRRLKAHLFRVLYTDYC